MADKPFEHPQQVREFLAATTGDDVLKAVEADDPKFQVGNNVGQAPVADPQAQPQPQPGQPQVNPTADPAAPAQPAAAPEADPQPTPQQAAAAPNAPQPSGQPAGEKLFLGKYRTEEEAMKAYHNLLHQNKGLLGKLDRYEQTIDLSQPAQPHTEAGAQPRQPVGTPRVDPAARSAKRQELLSGLQERYGFSEQDANGLIDLAAETASARAEAVYDAKSGPKERLEQAQQYMDLHYPDASKFGDEIAQFIETDAALKAMVQEKWNAEDYQGAMEIAFLRFERTRGAQTEEQMQANQVVRQEAVEQARGDANMISSSAASSPGVHETPASEVGVSPEEMNELVRLHRAGHRKPLLDATIAKDLPDSIFNPEGR
jgi:hypothetical protein